VDDTFHTNVPMITAYVARLARMDPGGAEKATAAPYTHPTYVGYNFNVSLT